MFQLKQKNSLSRAFFYNSELNLQDLQNTLLKKFKNTLNWM